MNRRELIQLIGLISLPPSCAWLDKIQKSVQSSTQVFSGYRIGEPYAAKESGLHIGGPGINSRVILENEIHSAIHSKALNTKVFLPKLQSVGYLQVDSGPLRSFRSPPGHYFYGHGVIDEKRGLLYTTQAEVTGDRSDTARLKKPGFIFVHSLPDLKPLGFFLSFGFDPHDLTIVGDQLVVCNGGFESNIAFIDLSTRSLRRQFTIADKNLSLRHVDMIDPDNYVVATLNRVDDKPCPLYRLNTKLGLKKHPSPDAVDQQFLRFQMLSVKAHGGYVYGTCPPTNSLVVYELDKGFVAALSVPSACNLSYSKILDAVVVGSAFQGEQARAVRVEQGKLVGSKIGWGEGLTGAHALLID